MFVVRKSSIDIAVSESMFLTLADLGGKKSERFRQSIKLACDK